MRYIPLITLFCSLAHSTTLPNIPYDKLIELSDAVVLGTVVSARFGGTNEVPCDAIYELNIEKVIKGTFQPGQVITYGPYSGQELGTKYLLFLDKQSSSRRLISSTNSAQEAAEEAYEQKCKDAKKADFSVVLEGVASIPVSVMNFDGKYKEVLHFPPMWVIPPERVRVVIDKEKETVWGRDKLVALEELLQ